MLMPVNDWKLNTANARGIGRCIFNIPRCPFIVSVSVPSVFTAIAISHDKMHIGDNGGEHVILAAMSLGRILEEVIDALNYFYFLFGAFDAIVRYDCFKLMVEIL
jgi:hypothetical protein